MKQFKSFINEDYSLNETDLKVIVYNLEDALKLSKLLQNLGFNYHKKFDNNTLKTYFDVYNIDNEGVFLVFHIWDKDTKEFIFNIMIGDVIEQHKKLFKFLDFPDNVYDITKTLQSMPSYQPKEFVYEKNNDSNTAREIAVKITSDDEFKILTDMLNTLRTSHIDKIYDDHFGFDKSKGNHYYFFCIDEDKVENCPGLVTRHADNPNAESINTLINDIESSGEFSGVYKKIFTIRNIKDIKNILKNKKIIITPQYNPRKFIYEDNKFKKINSFKNFILNNIFESDKTNKLSVPFVISERLQELLLNIEHPIAKKLVSESFNIESESTIATLIDYDEEEKDKFTYTVPNKFVDVLKKLTDMDYPTPNQNALYDIMKTNKGMYEEFRTSIKIGRLINKLFPKEYKPNGENSIESFVDIIKLERNRKFDNFEIVNGEDIIKYYNESSYTKDAFSGSELGNSCMRYDKCNDYLQFYAENKDVELVILKSDKEEDKIVARALLWNLSYANDKGVTGKFLDRIYFTKNFQKEIFIEHAKNNKWYHKLLQNYNADTAIWNPTNNEYEKIPLKTKSTFVKSSTNQYPYMDTMKWFYVDSGFVSNTTQYKEGEEDVYYMEDVNGEYVIEGKGKWSDYYNDYIDEEDSVYCEYGDDDRLYDDAIYIEDESLWATEEYANNHCVYIDSDGSWILKTKAVIYIDTYGNEEYTSQDYAINNYYHCQLDDMFYEDAVFSEYYDTYLHSDKIIEVYVSSDIDGILDGVHETDYLMEDDNNYFEYYPKSPTKRRLGPFYFINDLKNDFVLVTTDLEKDTTEWYHKEYDKYDIGQYKGKWVTEFIERTMKKKKGK